ncbi:hypothetical protein HAX54_049701 [Datura stramonium]|uniref:Uncharacterized protein n=1 Tax=Datura stramonium TaxID=4076 RepID=A0ABS8WMQ3_DATST|nr:hypothetical protein [Datura stramonium]
MMEDQRGRWQNHILRGLHLSVLGTIIMISRGDDTFTYKRLVNEQCKWRFMEKKCKSLLHEWDFITEGEEERALKLFTLLWEMRLSSRRRIWMKIGSGWSALWCKRTREARLPGLIAGQGSKGADIYRGIGGRVVEVLCGEEWGKSSSFLSYYYSVVHRGVTRRRGRSAQMERVAKTRGSKGGASPSWPLGPFECMEADMTVMRKLLRNFPRPPPEALLSTTLSTTDALRVILSPYPKPM